MEFGPYPLGTILSIGVDSSLWVGRFAGVLDGVAILNNAQLFANAGKPIDQARPVVRIPIRMITFVSVKGDQDNKKDKDNKEDNKGKKDDKGKK